MSVAKKAKKEEEIRYDTYVITYQHGDIEVWRVNSSLPSAKAVGQKILVDCQLFESNDDISTTDEEERVRVEREKKLAIFTGTLTLWTDAGNTGVAREAALVPQITQEIVQFFLAFDENERREWEVMGNFNSLGSKAFSWPICGLAKESKDSRWKLHSTRK